MINTAIVGIGYWGPNLVRNFISTKNTHINKVCDINESRLDFIKSRYPSLNIELDYSAILSDKNIDAVVLATPIETHYEMAKSALLSGKHVFVEKPLTMKSEEAQELKNLSESQNLILMVGHTFLYSPPVLKVSELIKNNELGNIKYIALTRINLGRIKHDTNVLWDLAPHDFSIILEWMGKLPQKIQVMGKAATFEGNVDVAFVNLFYEKDVLINIHMSWLSPVKVRQSYIIGDKKMIVYDDMHNSEKVKLYDMGVDLKEPDTFGEWQLTYRSGDVIVPRLDAYEPLQKECQHFIDCIVKGSKPKSDADQGIKIVKMIEAAQESLISGGIPVSL
ncbi:MAG: Gfo/Idh/MocA family oxidoreductase [Spirochaetes bacterium]|nr:Gfo/Idh/MocA family oxidoreductase [Spirochaetota bacterium]MCK5033482.1 Gfo/Idh/MocA family oxidoreductase [Calditrichia bacterium]